MSSTTSPLDDTDVHWMQKAIEEAHKSPKSESAYCVGCVIVENEHVLSTGYSRELPGNIHAEQAALMKANFKARGTTLYTTMEPCSVRTSGNTPCVQSCLKAGVERVVIGAREPKNFVECEGVRLLKDAGVNVIELQGLEEECLAPNRHLNLQTE